VPLIAGAAAASAMAERQEEHDRQGWVQRHWKEVAAVGIAVVPVAAYLLLSRNQSSAATPVYVATPSGGGAAAAPSQVATQAQQTVSNALATGEQWVLGGASAIPIASTPGTQQDPADYHQVGLLPAGAVVTVTGPATTAWWSTGPGTSPGHPTVYTAVPISYGGQSGYVNVMNLTSPVAPNAPAQTFSGL